MTLTSSCDGMRFIKLPMPSEIQLFCETTTVENPILRWLVGPVFGQRQRATTIETGKFDKLIQLRND